MSEKNDHELQLQLQHQLIKNLNILFSLLLFQSQKPDRIRSGEVFGWINYLNLRKNE